MYNTENKKSDLKFQQLLHLFNEVLEQSEDYHIVYFPRLGYVSLLGKYKPGCTTDIALGQLDFHKYFLTPEEMANSLMENLRWQWHMKTNSTVCTDDFVSITELDNELSEIDYPKYFQMIRKYELEVDKIIKNSVNQ